MPFIANTPEEQREMLDVIGVETIEDLFRDIPTELRCDELDLPDGKGELDVRRRISRLADHNTTNQISFLGGGFYDHFIPAALEALVTQSQFYTAYTPYQPEMSQGTLQAIYEFQSAICRLTDMEVANASLYDGGTAIYEAIMMAMRVTGRNKILIDATVNPIYRTMIRSYTLNLGIELIEIESTGGLADRELIAKEIDKQTAAVIVQNPNFFGCIDDFTDLADMIHEVKGLLITSTYPISLAMLKTPGEMGADIAVGEGQSLGMPISFGGPYLGFMSTRKKHMRKMPGRIVGRTVDAQDRDGFVLTLQAREQHIRREKATSNICTNQGLCALTALVYLSLMGKQGLVDIAETCASRAEYAKERLSAIKGIDIRFPDRPTFNEFVVTLPFSAEKVIRGLFHRNIAAGFPLGRYFPDMGNCLLLSVTEKRTRADIDYLAHTLEVLL